MPVPPPKQPEPDPKDVRIHQLTTAVRLRHHMTMIAESADGWLVSSTLAQDAALKMGPPGPKLAIARDMKQVESGRAAEQDTPQARAARDHAEYSRNGEAALNTLRENIQALGVLMGWFTFTPEPTEKGAKTE